MRARRSSIPLPMRHPSRPALRSAARPHLDPRSRSRRLVGVFASGATASRRRGFLTGRRCDGVARGPAGASAVGRGGPKGRERAVQALRPQFKSSGARAQPCAARASGAGSCSPQKSIRPAGGLRDEGTSTATRTSPAREFLTLAFPVFRAHARAGEGSQGPLGPVTRPREAWCSAAVEQRCSEWTARFRLREGGGLTKRQATTTPLRSPFLEPSPFVHRTPYMPATVRR